MQKDLEELDYLDFNEEELEDTDNEVVEEENDEDIIEESEDDLEDENQEEDEEEEDQDSEVEESEVDTQPKKKNGFQKRIEKLNQKKREAEERAEALEARLAEIEEKINGKNVSETEEDEPLPKLSDFDGDEDVYTQKLTEAIVKRELKNNKKVEAENVFQSKVENYKEKIMSYGEKRPEFLDNLKKIKEDEIMDFETTKYIIQDSKNSIGVHYELTKDINKFREFIKKSPSAQLSYVKKLDEKISEKKNKISELKRKNNSIKINNDISSAKSNTPKRFSEDMSLEEYRAYRKSKK